MTKTWAEIMNEARQRAYSGIFTDDPEEKDSSTYLVEDMQDVIMAFAKDIEDGEKKDYADPEDFLNAHGIKWE